MITIQLLALFLLIARLGSATFIFIVIQRQPKLLNLPFDKEEIDPDVMPKVRRYRYILFGLSLAIFVGNLIPIVIDAATLFVDTSRPPNVKPLSIGYAMSNALTSLTSSYLIWNLYRLSRDERKITQLTAAALKENKPKDWRSK